MKEFHIKHDKESIRLETEFTKFDSLERIMLLSAMEFIKKGKTDELKIIMAVIEARMI
jgi:hypothetical protein